MSVSNSRHSLLALFSSKSMGKRLRSRIATAARSSKRRSLRMEALERRQLMASDVAASLHNSLVPHDVNGDFEISPIDVLQVINAMNRQSRASTTFSTEATSSARSPMVDVDNDGNVSPIDALMVINRLRTGEGVGEIAEIGVQVLNSSNAIVTPTIGAGGVPEYTFAPGEKFTIRTRAKDLRPSPAGVFTAYVDMNYATEGSATTELAQVLWSEVQTLNFSKGTNGGTFTLQYGNETTTPITFGPTLAATRNNVASAIGALNFVGGTSNVRVTSLPETSVDGAAIDIFFVGNLARQDVQNVALGSNNLTVSGAGPNTLLVGSKSDPADKLVVSAAVSFPANQIAAGDPTAVPPVPPTFLAYNGGSSEATLQTIGTTGLRLNDIGNFGFTIQAPEFDDPASFVNVFDTAFRASSQTGRVEFNIGPSGNSRNTVLMYGSDTAVADNLIDFPDPFRIVIASDLLANPDTASIAQNSGASTIVVGANDQFKTGTNFTVTATGPSSGGSVAIVNGTSNAQAAVTFTPTPGFAGQTTFTYTITNDQSPAKTSTSTVTVNVNAPNNPPVPLATPLNATEAGPSVTFTPVQLFSPGNGESSQSVTLSNVALVSGSVGSISIDGSGNVSYTPPANDFFGNVLFTVTGTDTGVPPAQTTATFTINVADVNDAPLAKSTNVNTLEDIPATILASDLFSPGPGNEVNTQTVSLISVVPVSGQTGGSISVVGGNAQFTPVSNFSGSFLFVAVAQDNGSPSLQSQESTITINVGEVNDPPTAVADTGQANRFTARRTPTVPTDLDVMRNDSTGGDPGDAIRITAVTQPASGLVEIGPNGSVVRYTPSATTPISSIQSFTYTITDNGGETSTATAEIFIDPPTLPFAVNDTAEVSENGAQIIINVLANDFGNIEATKQLLGVLSGLSPSGAGTLVLLDNGTSDPSDDTFGFTPATSFTGPAVFTYRMSDSSEGSQPSIGTVVISVGDINDPPTVVNQTVDGVEDTVLTIPSATVLANSSPGPGESDQTLTVTAASVATAGAGTAVVTNGNVVFTPTANFNGPALIIYTATDNGTTNGQPDPKSASATITVNVAPVNDVPTATATNGFTIPEDSSTPLTVNASSLFSPGPADEASQTVSLTSVSAAPGQTGGSIVLSGGNAVFTPALNYNGTFSFIAVAQDNGTPAATSQPSTITITVTPVNDSPVPLNATRSANATIPIVIDLSPELANASRGGGPDEATQTLTVTRVIPLTGANATRGTVSRNANGTINYVAPAGFSGPDSFEYEVIDNGTTNGQSDPKTSIARVTVNVVEFVPSSIRGQVWVDDDFDGAMDSDELLIGGIEIELTGRAIGATSDITPIRRITQANGDYSFEGLSPGTYVVKFTPPFKMVDAPANNVVTQTIQSPGGTNSVQNFAVYGFEAGYNGVLDNLESNYYLRNGQEWRQKGLTTLLRADGSPAWIIHHGGFEGYRSESVRIASDGVYLSVVQSDSTVLETKLPRNMYLSCRDADGNTLLRIFATTNQVKFAPVIRSSSDAEAEGHASNVDRIFAEMGQ